MVRAHADAIHFFKCVSDNVYSRIKNYRSKLIFFQVMKPLSTKASRLQEQLLGQLTNLLMEKVRKLLMMKIVIIVMMLMNLLQSEENDCFQSCFAANHQISCLAFMTL